MKTLKIFMMAGLMILAMGCKSVRQTGAVFEYGNEPVRTYVKANLDLENATPVEGKVDFAYFLGIRTKGGGGTFTGKQLNSHKYSTAESRVLYNVMSQSGADVILNPKFYEEKHSWCFGLYRTKTIKVKGYATKIKNFENDK